MIALSPTASRGAAPACYERCAFDAKHIHERRLATNVLLMIGGWAATFRFFNERQKLNVSFHLHFLDGNKLHGGRVYGITLTGWRWPVVEQMPKMRVTFGGPNLYAVHVERGISCLYDTVRRNRLGEGRPAGIAIKFVGRTEKWIPRDNVDIDAGPNVGVALLGAAPCSWPGLARPG